MNSILNLDNICLIDEMVVRELCIEKAVLGSIKGPKSEKSLSHTGLLRTNYENRFS